MMRGKALVPFTTCRYPVSPALFAEDTAETKRKYLQEVETKFIRD